MAATISKKRKFVADGVFRAELGEFFTRELSEEGYSGCEVRVTHARTEVRCHYPTSTCPTLRSNRHSQFGGRGGGVGCTKIDYYPRDAYAGSARREGKAYSRAHVARSEEVQVPRGLARTLRRKGSTPRSLRRCTM